jgi:DNA-directed RNA polymerase subunit RPC12/RpoP
MTSAIVATILAVWFVSALLFAYDVRKSRPAHRAVANLHRAYSWDCEDCGRENFVRQLRIEERKRCAGGGTSVIVGSKFPLTVKCRHCGRIFEAEED